MRKIWIICGWILFVMGVVLVVSLGLAWLGGGEAPKMISSIALGVVFILLGWNFVARGRSLPTYGADEDSEASRHDRSEARRMMVQAIWIGGCIILGVALVVVLWVVFSSPR
jgi:hypothetical protein